MTTTADVLSRVRHRVMSGARDQLNKLDEDLDTSETDVTFEFDAGGIAPGARLAVDLEEMFVWSVASKTATVLRGFNGSTPAEHDDGDLVYVNPVLSDFEILRAVNAELDALSSPSNGLFRVATVDLTYSPSVQGYNLTSVTSIENVVGVFADQPDSSQNWIPVGPGQYRLLRNQSTGDFASGFSLTFLGGALSPGRAARVVYRAPFSNLSTVADDVETVAGLHAQAHDVLELGAALRVMSGRPVKRAFTEGQGETRRAEEVTVRDVIASTALLRQEYEERVAEEASRLTARYPTMRAA